MKKVIIIIIAVIILGAGGYFIFSQAKNGPEAKTDASKDIKGLKVNKNNTLLGWLKRGKGVRCAIKSEDEEVIMQTKNNKVRIDGLAGMMGQTEEETEEPGAMISDGEWVYIWSGTGGMKMNIKDMQESMPEEQKAQAKDYSWENMAKAWQDEEAEYDCKEARIADTIFTPPNNIEFVDFSQFMSGMTDLGEKFEEKYGTDEESDEAGSANEEATPEDIEEMMKDMEKMMEETDLPEEVGTQMKMVE